MLTDSQKVDVRRWMGYPAHGAPGGVVPFVFMHTSGVTQELDARLITLTAAEEVVLTDTYLANLTLLETAILTAQENFDTEIAGPWTANRREVSQRTSLFNQWRRDMCGFLGFEPGPSLGAGGLTLVRA